MTREEIEQATATLKAFQKWRTGEDDRTMEDAGIVAGEVTKAIDAALQAIRENEKLKFHLDKLINPRLEHVKLKGEDGFLVRHEKARAYLESLTK